MRSPKIFREPNFTDHESRTVRADFFLARGAATSSNAGPECVEVVEHLAQRHALYSVLGFDQNHLVGPSRLGSTEVPFERGIEIVEVSPIPWLMPRSFRASAMDFDTVRFIHAQTLL